MSPRIKAAKIQVTKAVDASMHIAMGLGTNPPAVILKPAINPAKIQRASSWPAVSANSSCFKWTYSQ
jgi:hypothetical protein